METAKRKLSAKVLKMPARAMAVPADAHGETDPSSYYGHIIEYAQRIRMTHDTGEIIRILDEALKETRSLHALDELDMARRQVADAERKISTLKAELEEVSGLLREDPLTGALNRRGLEDIYTRDAARCDRRSIALCLVLLDLDNFKILNDTHGHPAGDAALIGLTQLARATLRPTDSIARIGGEEFVLLLPDTDLDAALAATNRLAAALANARLLYASAEIKISFSAGIALRNSEEALLSMLCRADDALYKAKHAGKNRAEIA
ncbi:MAG: GGDEF domain-containing protein [Georgfuchsia sp.]